jgi:hypothetical protein
MTPRLISRRRNCPFVQVVKMACSCGQLVIIEQPRSFVERTAAVVLESARRGLECCGATYWCPLRKFRELHDWTRRDLDR